METLETFKQQYQIKPVEYYPNNVANNALVSVCVMTYQHSLFIKECLDGILMQETSFPFEILLGEDASTDGTREICIEYAEKYPEKIKLFLHHRENNIKINGSPTGRFNFLYNLYSARGKYIALCEGDDYWTDPLKLQKQVDFLEANPDFTICFHNVQVVNETYPEKNHLINNKDTKSVSTLEDLLEGVNYIGTTSMMLRASAIPSPIPSWFSQLPFGDYGLSLLCASKGKIKYIDQVMAVYRIHPLGIHGHLFDDPVTAFDGLKKGVLFWNVIEKSQFFKTQKVTNNKLRLIKAMITIAKKERLIIKFVNAEWLLITHSQSLNTYTRVMNDLVQYLVFDYISLLRYKLGLGTLLRKILKNLNQ